MMNFSHPQTTKEMQFISLQAVCDSSFLIFANLVYSGASLLSPSQYLPLLKSIPVLVPLIHISLTASVYTTVAVAVERYSTLIDALKKVRQWNMSNNLYYHTE